MCTFSSDRQVMVCDSAIETVRARLEPVLAGVRFTHVEMQGTLVEAGPEDSMRFRGLVEAAIEEAAGLRA